MFYIIIKHKIIIKIKIISIIILTSWSIVFPIK